ncbi:hypothetical protein Gotur_007637, partial [Gossypium turneri]
VAQNNLQELKEIWDQWDDEIKQLFYCEYGDLSYLLDVKVYKHLFRDLTQYWNHAYSYFTSGKVDLVPTIEEYTTLLRCPRIQVDKAYSRVANILTFLRRLMNITGMSEPWVAAQIKQKGDSKCIPWKSLRDLILVHPDAKKRVNIFALSIYELVIFLKVLGHIDDAVLDLFDRLDKRVTSILVEKVYYRVFSEDYSPLKEFVAIPIRDNISEEKWMAILQSLQDKDVEWRTLRMILNEILSRQFIPATQRLGQCEFVYKGDNYKKKWGKRINDNVPSSSQENTRPIEEHLQVIPSELDIVK